MGVHMFTKIKNTDGWKHKKIFFSYFISEIPHFSYMRFYRKWAMFRWSIPLTAFVIPFGLWSAGHKHLTMLHLRHIHYHEYFEY